VAEDEGVESRTGYGIEGSQGPIGHGKMRAEEALGNADEYVVETAPVYPFYPQNTPSLGCKILLLGYMNRDLPKVI